MRKIHDTCHKYCDKFAAKSELACLTCGYPQLEAVINEILILEPGMEEEVEYEIRVGLLAKYKEEIGLTHEMEEQLMANEKLSQLLARLGEPVIECCRGKDDYAGVLFDKFNGIAFAGSGQFILHISGLNQYPERILDIVPAENPFWNYYSESFEANPLPMTLQQLDELFEKHTFNYVIRVPVLNVLEELEKRCKDAISMRNCFVIIDVMCARPSKKPVFIVPAFEKERDSERWHWNIPSDQMPYTLIIDEKVSYYTNDDIEPNTSYLVEPLSDPFDNLIPCNVLREYAIRSRFIVYDKATRGQTPGFEIFDVESYGRESLFSFPLDPTTTVPRDFVDYEPVAIQANLFYQMFRICRTYDFIDIHVQDSVSPILLEAVKDSVGWEKDPRINALIYPIVFGNKPEGV